MDQPTNPEPSLTPEQQREVARQARLDRYTAPYYVGTLGVVALVFFIVLEISETGSWRSAVPGCAAALALAVWLGVHWQSVKQRDDAAHGQ